MGVYIKGMKKPNNCGSCHFNESNTHCFITKGKIDRDDYTCEIECPIVEVKTPHGKLIDADTLADDLEYDAANEQDFYKANCASWLRSECNPTVIEAEVE